MFVTQMLYAQDSTVAVTDNTTADSVFYFDTVTAASLPMLTQHTIPESTLQRIRSDAAFWYANVEFKKEKEKTITSDTSFLQKLFSKDWFRNLLWAIIICSFIAMVFLFLFQSNIRLFHRKPTAIGEIGEDVRNIFSINYESEISSAVAQSNFRLAIRLHFLQTLFLLAEKNRIQYKEDFTNSDYIDQLQQTTLYRVFKKLTRDFEYAWYGKFNITAAAYQHIEADFKTFKANMEI